MIDNSYPEYIDNRTIVEEEKLGKAHAFVVGHRTTINDPSILESIRRMSILEVVS